MVKVGRSFLRGEVSEEQRQAWTKMLGLLLLLLLRLDNDADTEEPWRSSSAPSPCSGASDEAGAQDSCISSDSTADNEPIAQSCTRPRGSKGDLRFVLPTPNAPTKPGRTVPGRLRRESALPLPASPEAPGRDDAPPRSAWASSAGLADDSVPVVTRSSTDGAPVASGDVDGATFDVKVIGDFPNHWKRYDSEDRPPPPPPPPEPVGMPTAGGSLSGLHPAASASRECEALAAARAEVRLARRAAAAAHAALAEALAVPVQASSGSRSPRGGRGFAGAGDVWMLPPVAENASLLVVPPRSFSDPILLGHSSGAGEGTASAGAAEPEAQAPRRCPPGRCVDDGSETSRCCRCGCPLGPGAASQSAASQGDGLGLGRAVVERSHPAPISVRRYGPRTTSSPPQARGMEVLSARPTPATEPPASFASWIPEAAGEDDGLPIGFGRGKTVRQRPLKTKKDILSVDIGKSSLAVSQSGRRHRVRPEVHRWLSRPLPENDQAGASVDAAIKRVMGILDQADADCDDEVPVASNGVQSVQM